MTAHSAALYDLIAAQPRGEWHTVEHGWQDSKEARVAQQNIMAAMRRRGLRCRTMRSGTSISVLITEEQA